MLNVIKIPPSEKFKTAAREIAYSLTLGDAELDELTITDGHVHSGDFTTSIEELVAQLSTSKEFGNFDFPYIKRINQALEHLS